MAKTPKVGYTCTLNIAGNPLARGKDIKLNGARGEADISSRAGGGFKDHLGGLAEWSVDGGVVWVADQVTFAALQAAYLAGTVLAITFLDSHGDGYSGSAWLSKWEVNQPLNGGVEVSFALKGTGALTVVTVA